MRYLRAVRAGPDRISILELDEEDETYVQIIASGTSGAAAKAWVVLARDGKARDIEYYRGRLVQLEQERNALVDLLILTDWEDL